VAFILPIDPFFGVRINSKVDTPVFFTSGTYKKYIAPNDTLLVVPYGGNGNSTLWQAQTDMYFRMAGGRVGLEPLEFSRWPAVTSLDSDGADTDFAEQLEAFVVAHDVKAIVVAGKEKARWPAILSPLGIVPIQAADVLLYQIPQALRDRYKDITPEAMQIRHDQIRYSALISGANEYVLRGFPLAKLTPWEAERLGLFSLRATAGEGAGDAASSGNWQEDVWLGSWTGDKVGVGIVGPYAAIARLVDKYGTFASEVFFPFPNKLSPGHKPGDIGQLLMVFSGDQLSRTAEAVPRAPDNARFVTEDSSAKIRHR
jgi:hypothetical protein